jgi:hypothetical protein
VTAQWPDRVVYQAQQYFIAGKKGAGLLTPISFGIEVCVLATAAYRGYVCEYSIINQQLYLTEVMLQTLQRPYPELAGVQSQVHENLPVGYYPGLQIECPFSGGLVVVQGPLQKHSSGVLPNPASYEIVKEMIFQDGRVTNLIDHSTQMAEIRYRLDELEALKTPINNDYFRTLRKTEDTLRYFKELDELNRQKGCDWKTLKALEWSFAPGYEEQPD